LAEQVIAGERVFCRGLPFISGHLVEVETPDRKGRLPVSHLRSRKNDLIIFLASGFFAGFLPYMPGTWGTLFSTPLVLLAHKTGDGVQFVLLLLFFPLAVFCAGRAEILFERTDARAIVIDEIYGFLVTLLFVPLDFFSLALGFIFFRFFDIIKPPPIRLLEKRFTGGLAVVLDDVLAGIFANLALRGVLALVSGAQ